MAATKVVSDALVASKHEKSTVLLLLDMEKAFDTVWHAGLLYKLAHDFHIPMNLVFLLKSYLSSRSFCVRVNSSLSEPKTIGAGVPQGTVIAPKLYTLYTSDVPQFPTTQTLLYADDTAIYASSFWVQAANKRIKYHLSPLLRYYARWKININANKTEEIVLTKKFTNTTVFEKLKINDSVIEIKNRAKYLGVVLDRTLSFKPHISQTLTRAYMTTQKLYALLAKDSCMSLANKALLYRTIIRPILVYACPVWQSCSATQRKRLQVMQNKILRFVTNSHRYVSIAEMHASANVPTLNDYINETAQKFYTTNIHNSLLTTNIADIKYGHNLRKAHKLIHQDLPIYFDN